MNLNKENIVLEKVVKDKENILKQLLEFYLYDFNNYYEDDLNENGRFDFIDTTPYFTQNNYSAFFIKVNDKYAGFVLLIEKNETVIIEEFWIMPKYRKGYFAINILNKVMKLYNNKNYEFIILNENIRWLNVIEYLINKNFNLISKEKFIKWENVEFTKFIIKRDSLILRKYLSKDDK